MDAVKSFLAKDSVKIALFFVSLVCGGVIAQWPPPHMAGNIAGVVIACLAGLGITSGGTSGLRSNVSNQQTEQLKASGVVKPPG